MAQHHGKRYKADAAQVDKSKLYAPVDAVALCKEIANAKFDETVEVHFRLGIDPRKADQNVRGSIALPHGTGKSVRVAVFAEGELKAGRVEYRADRYGICHIPMGRVSFSVEDLVENYGALMTEILRVKPSTAKGKYVKSVAISSTMGPGIKIDPLVTRNFMESAEAAE